MLFKAQNLDFLCIARCAPNHSYLNPAERVTGTLNYGIQNCALARLSCADDPVADEKSKRADGMNSLREAISNDFV